jgi:hypothetical protein
MNGNIETEDTIEVEATLKNFHKIGKFNQSNFSINFKIFENQ